MNDHAIDAFSPLRDEICDFRVTSAIFFLHMSRITNVDRISRERRCIIVQEFKTERKKRSVIRNVIKASKLVRLFEEEENLRIIRVTGNSRLGIACEARLHFSFPSSSKRVRK